MANEALIRYKLGLVLRLIDSVTGKLITVRDVRFLMPEGIGPPVPKGEGVYLFMNISRENFRLGVCVYGYEPVKALIDFSRIDERMPATEIFLIPKDELPRSESMLSVKGILKGMESIECVSLRNVAISVKEFEEDTRILTMFNPHRESFEYDRYGIINDSYTEYDELDVAKELSKQKVELNSVPEHGCFENQPIMRIIPGQVSDDGSFVLRVPNTASADYLVCYRQAGQKHFRRLDFRKTETKEEGGVPWEL